MHGTNFRSMKSFGHFFLPIVNSDYIIVRIDLIFTGFGDINRMSMGMRKISRASSLRRYEDNFFCSKIIVALSLST
jgi:hypothetical protein